MDQDNDTVPYESFIFSEIKKQNKNKNLLPYLYFSISQVCAQIYIYISIYIITSHIFWEDCNLICVGTVYRYNVFIKLALVEYKSSCFLFSKKKKKSFLNWYFTNKVQRRFERDCNVYTIYILLPFGYIPFMSKFGSEVLQDRN